MADVISVLTLNDCHHLYDLVTQSN
jgi:hypothetical protein